MYMYTQSYKDRVRASVSVQTVTNRGSPCTAKNNAITVQQYMQHAGIVRDGARGIALAIIAATADDPCLRYTYSDILRWVPWQTGVVIAEGTAAARTPRLFART